MRPITADAVVTTADGTLYRVRHAMLTVDGVRCAELEIEEGARYGMRVTLPMAELRRVVDPSRKLPPIAGLPTTQRPICPNCHHVLKPVVRTTRSRDYRRVERREFLHWDAHHGYFCTNTCAGLFGHRAYLRGFRLTERNP